MLILVSRQADKHQRAARAHDSCDSPLSFWLTEMMFASGCSRKKPFTCAAVTRQVEGQEKAVEGSERHWKVKERQWKAVKGIGRSRKGSGMQ